MPAAVYILFGVAFTAAVSIAAGRILIARLRLPLDRGERIVFSFLLGSILVSNLVFLLCCTQLARKGVFLVAGIVILMVAARVKLPPTEPAPPPASTFWKWLLGIAGGAYFLLYFCNAMAPEISPDGSSYHLGLVARYLREHGFHRIATNMYASLSQGVEMLFLFAFAFGRHSAAAMVHFTFLLALAALLLLYARRTGMPAAGVCAALFVLASPMFGIDGISAYIDVGVAAVIFAVFYLLEIWDAQRTPGLLIAIGLLAGFAYAMKYTAVLAVPYAAGFVAWKSWRRGKPVWKPAFTIATCALAMMLPWLVKNIVLTGNPFAPLLNAWFPNPYVTAGFEHDYTWYMRHYEEVRSYSQLPWMLTVTGSVGGLFGPLFVLAPVALIALRWREGRRLLMAAAIFGSVWWLNIGARFLIPAAPFLALALAMVLIRWKPLAVVLVVVHAVFSWPALMPLYCSPGAWRLRQIPIRAALRLETEDTFLDANLPNYRMARLVERTVPRKSTVLSFSGLAEAYTTRNVITAGQSAFTEQLRDILWIPMVDGMAPTWILEFAFPATPVERLRVVQSARSKYDQWNIAELRVFRGGVELARGPQWRMRAQPNPFEIGNAFDRTLITRWRTWLSIEGRELVDLDFGKPETIDRVRLECSHDQQGIKLHLEALDASGRWRTIADAPQPSDAPAIPDLRRMATAEAKRRGVDYIAIDHNDFGAADYRAHSDQWGLIPVGVQGDDWLCKIQ